MHWHVLLPRHLKNNVQRLLGTLQQAGKSNVNLEVGTPQVRRGPGGLIFAECCQLHIRPPREQASFVPRALAMTQENDFAVWNCFLEPHASTTATNIRTHTKAQRCQQLRQKYEHYTLSRSDKSINEGPHIL